MLIYPGNPVLNFGNNLSKRFIGDWKCNENAGTMAMDRSLLKRNCSVIGAPSHMDTPFGGALLFNGSSQRLNTTINNGLSGSFAFCAWIYPTANINNVQQVMASEVASYSNYWAIMANGTISPILNKGCFALYDGSNNPLVMTQSVLTLNKWTFLVGVRDKTIGKILIYQDGIFQNSASDSTTSVPAYSNFNIGAQVNVATRYFYGGIGMAKVLSFAPSASDVMRLYLGTENLYTKSRHVQNSISYNRLRKIICAAA